MYYIYHSTARTNKAYIIIIDNIVHVVCERACGTSLNKHRKEGIYGGGWQIYV
jgi:hypothetical protein